MKGDCSLKVAGIAAWRRGGAALGSSSMPISAAACSRPPAPRAAAGRARTRVAAAFGLVAQLRRRLRPERFDLRRGTEKMVGQDLWVVVCKIVALDGAFEEAAPRVRVEVGARHVLPKREPAAPDVAVATEEFEPSSAVAEVFNDRVELGWLVDSAVGGLL